MAGKKLETHSVIVAFADIIWYKPMNRARPTGDYGTESELNSLKQSLARDCWKKDTNGLVLVDEISKPEYAEALKAVMEDRKTIWDALKVKAKEDPNKETYLRVWEGMFTVNGKLKTPKLFGVTGNRRASQFPEAMGIRRQTKDEETGKFLEVDDTVAVLIGDYTDPTVRLRAQIGENEGKNQNFKEASPVDQLINAEDLLATGYTQSDLRHIFSSPTTGVRAFFLIQLDRKFQNVRILERCKMEPTIGTEPNPLWIPIRSVSHAVLQGMGQRFTAEETDAYNRKNVNKKDFKPQPVLTEEEVRTYFSDVTKAKEDKVDRTMDKNGIHQIATVNANPIVREVASAISNNRKEDLGKLNLLSTACDALVRLRDEGDLPGAEKILVALVKLPKGNLRDEAEKKVFAALGV